MDNNLNNLEESDTFIEDISDESLLNLDETLESDTESDLSEGKYKTKMEADDEEDDMEDDGEGLDKPGSEDSDVDNDGDSDESDEYLKNRRKTVAKAMKKEEAELEEAMDDSTKIIKLSLPYVSDEDKDEDAELNRVAKMANQSAAKNKFKVLKVEGDGEEIYVTFSGPKKPLIAFARQHLGPSNKGDTDDEIMKDWSESIETSDISRLIESEEGLSEEFKTKATFIFEAAVNLKVSEIESSLQEAYETRLSEETETIKSTLEEQVDNYLTYAVETWMEDNKVAIESSLRTQIAENFIGALKNVFVEHYVEVPESKVDLFDQIEKENATLKEEAAKTSRIADRLADRVDTLVREKIIAEASVGLADTQADKLKKLAEDIEFVDEDTFSKKVETIKEFYLSSNSNVSDTTLTENADNSYFSTETIVEEDTSDVSPEMKQYLNALSRMNRAMTADLS